MDHSVYCIGIEEPAQMAGLLTILAKSIANNNTDTMG